MPRAPDMPAQAARPQVPQVAPVQPPRVPGIAPVIPPVAHVAPRAPSVAPVVRPVAPVIAPVAPVIAPVVPPVAAAVPRVPGAADSSGGGQLSNDQLAELERLTRIMDQVDYFELLGVSKDATPADIKRAFYKSSRAFHPDRFYQVKDSALKAKVHEVYKRVTEAYALLRDDTKRPRYLADVTGPDRAQKLRFTEAAETEARLQKKKEQEEQIGTTPKGRQFYLTGYADLEAGRFASAERNLKMAVTYEPANQRYKDALKAAQDKLLDDSRRSGGSQFKIK